MMIFTVNEGWNVLSDNNRDTMWNIPYMGISKSPVAHDLNKRMCVFIDQLLLTNRFGRKQIYDNSLADNA